MMAAAHEDTKIVPSLRGGTSIVSVKPIFSPDGEYLITCAGDLIKVLSIRSGECVHRLRGHRDKVTGIQINPWNQYQLLSCGLDQQLIKWDFSDGVLLKKYKLGSAFHHLFAVHEKPQCLYAVWKTGGRRGTLINVFLPTSSDDNIKTEHVMHVSINHANHISIGCKGKIAAHITGSKLTVVTLSDKKSVEHHVPKDNINFSCVACHPTEFSIATGLTNGELVLWHNFLKGNKVTRTSYHWHALGILDLAFTQEGSFTLTGGHECVLVKWQHNSHNRDTLPRLGSAIVGITCSRDNSLYATSHADNGIQVVTSNFRIVQAFQGLTKGHMANNRKYSLPTGLLVDPRTKAMVLNGKPGHLQFYSLHNDKQLFNLDIVCQNYISSESRHRPLVTTEVENAAFSHDGSWLATLERRDDGETTPDVRLKFWSYDQKKRGYTLNTNVDVPHTKPVHTLKFRPQADGADLMAVTTSADGKFKLWCLVDDTDIYRENTCWSCESVGFYRHQPAGKADFSEDGSILAVTFNSVVTIWDPDTNALRTTLRHGIDQSEIRHLLFGRGEYSHMMMTVTSRTIYAWNMLSCSVEWEKTLKVQVLVQSTTSNLIAAFTSYNELYVFKPDTQEPVYHHPNVSANHSVAGAIFIPHAESPNDKEESEDEELSWQSKDQLYFMTSGHQLLTLDVEQEVEDSPLDKTGMLAQNLPETPFSILMSENRKSGVKDVQSSTGRQKHGQPGATFLHEILGAAAHTLPPISTLCKPFLETLMIKKKSDKMEEEDDDDDDEVVVPMETSDPESATEDEMSSDKTQATPSKPAEPALDINPEYRILKPSKNFKWMQRS